MAAVQLPPTIAHLRLKIRISGNYGIWVKWNKILKLQLSTQFFKNSIRQLSKIAKKQRQTFSSNQYFQWNLANSQYTLQTIVAPICHNSYSSHFPSQNSSAGTWVPKKAD